MWGWRSWIQVILCCVELAGCGGQALDVGSNDGGATRGDEPPPAPDPISDASFATAATREVWSGHLVNHQFTDGSDALTMTLDFAANGTVTGSLLLGSGSILQPPTDPNVGYPPGNLGQVVAVEGFPYTILDGTSIGPHLTFHVAESEVWTQWCALQTSYPVLSFDGGPAYTRGPNFYSCSPSYPNQSLGFDSSGCYVDDVPINCGKSNLCMHGVCQCSATGCQVDTNSGADIALDLDLLLPNTRAAGTITGEFGTYDVRFTRTE